MVTAIVSYIRHLRIFSNPSEKFLLSFCVNRPEQKNDAGAEYLFQFLKAFILPLLVLSAGRIQKTFPQ